MLAAMKFHCYASTLSTKAFGNSRMGWQSIQQGIDYLYNLVKARVKGARTRYADCEVPDAICLST